LKAKQTEVDLANQNIAEIQMTCQALRLEACRLRVDSEVYDKVTGAVGIGLNYNELSKHDNIRHVKASSSDPPAKEDSPEFLKKTVKPIYKTFLPRDIVESEALIRHEIRMEDEEKESREQVKSPQKSVKTEISKKKAK